MKPVQDSDDSSTDDDDDDDDDEGLNKSNKRKNIRRVLADKDLEDVTKKAAREELDRRKRLEERQKLVSNTLVAIIP